MTNPNNWHPYPRYGLAAAVVEQNAFAADLRDVANLGRLAKRSLELGLSRCLLYTQDTPRIGNRLSYQNLPRDQYFTIKAGSNYKLRTRWGSEIKKANGFLIAPHVLTGSNAGGMVSKVLELLVDLSKPVESHSETALFQSFAPVVTEVLNEGRLSPSDPKSSLLEAAFTAVATLSALKPCVYARVPLSKDEKPDFANYGLIPDLDIWTDNAVNKRPLIEFVRVFKALSETYEGDKYTTNVNKQGEYARPPAYSGNFPGANRFSSGPLDVISLLAALGRWAREVGSFCGPSATNWAILTLNSLQERPIYIVSNAGTMQETFGHHLVELAKLADLNTIVWALHQTDLFYEESSGNDAGKTDSTPKEKLFRMMSERFLRQYTLDAFHNFLAHRAAYSIELEVLINHYMTQQRNIDLEIVRSARIYGASLNKAAYEVAKENFEKDPSRTIYEYKNRVLTELESTVGSAISSSGESPLRRLATIIGRATHRDIDAGAYRFIEAVFVGEITPKEAHDLIIVFMRLRSPTSPKQNAVIGNIGPSKSDLQPEDVASQSTILDAYPDDIDDEIES